MRKARKKSFTKSKTDESNRLANFTDGLTLMELLRTTPAKPKSTLADEIQSCDKTVERYITAIRRAGINVQSRKEYFDGRKFVTRYWIDRDPCTCMSAVRVTNGEPFVQADLSNL